MLKKTLSALLSILCIVSCSKDIPTIYSDIPVVFKESEVETKTSGIIATADLNSIGIWGYSTGAVDFNHSSVNGDTPNYMYCQLAEKVTANGNTYWNYTPIKYWPYDGKVSFFAYAPYSASGINSCSNTNKGYPYIHYIVPANPNYQADLLLSAPVTNCTSSTNTVQFNFKHVLSKIRFASDGFKINSLTVGGAKGEGIIGYDENGNLTWSNLEYENNFTLNGSGDYEMSADGTGVSTLAGTMMMIPQTNTLLELTISYETLTEPIRTVTNDYTTLNVTWEMGKSYKYIISIRDNKLVISVVIGKFGSNNDDDSWVDGYNGNDNEQIGG